MSNRFRVSSTLSRKLEDLGLSPDTVLRQAGLPRGLFKPERILVNTEEFFALHRGIAEASNDPAIGLKLGIEERIERYDPVKLAALSAPQRRVSRCITEPQTASNYRTGYEKPQISCPREKPRPVRLPIVSAKIMVTKDRDTKCLAPFIVSVNGSYPPALA
ncbi:MAG TPA: AraC family transcriptional regulator ligand-binding domain-containing protein [Terriglobales bacterium]|nr:AraC family transcriptional regulator ligand-binding domain-containing protein [Terriglobales bacterium]